MILVCGEALYDMFSDNTSADPIGFEAHIGGSPYNVAIGLARLGQKPAFFGGISTDQLGEKLLARLAEEGVETTNVHRSPALTTLSLVQKTAAGQPVYTFYGENAADRMVTEADLPLPDQNFAMVHIGSYTALVEPVASALKNLIERERPNSLIAFDPNIRPTVVPDMNAWKANTHNLAAVADVIKVSDEDLALIEPLKRIDDIAQGWIEQGSGLVVVTRGANGAEVYTVNGRYSFEGQKVAVADTVGAGDTFQAALLMGLTELGICGRDELARLDDSHVTRLVSFAIEASALTCTRRGADLPRKSELRPF
ncbi:fructokinase [Roseibium hamelinense]|uniref:Fructokinase n=1 Tax=Roseibium hamelinense TaxID=150831 RepID=A0A562TBF5_9HYPH|nr:carbohydrate kinase [Roseibium hamelinense]MTI45327.1 carbohydrate kinase [Roseibium hamelinense]TWI90306.1 fructokinase [Roseibium hamelinense]